MFILVAVKVRVKDFLDRRDNLTVLSLHDFEGFSAIGMEVELRRL